MATVVGLVLLAMVTIGVAADKLCGGPEFKGPWPPWGPR